jgi:hypothetical protein
VLADREGDGPSRTVNLLGELDARRRGAHAELVEGRPDVRFHGSQGDIQRLPNLLVGLPDGHSAQDLTLAIRELDVLDRRAHLLDEPRRRPRREVGLALGCRTHGLHQLVDIGALQDVPERAALDGSNDGRVVCIHDGQNSRNIVDSD